jgi:hypothetical protein
MTVKELIEILLDKCALDASVLVVDENGEFVNLVEFIEFDVRDNSVLFYDSEPNFEECREGVEVTVLVSEARFAETVYREL